MSSFISLLSILSISPIFDLVFYILARWLRQGDFMVNYRNLGEKTEKIKHCERKKYMHSLILILHS